MNLHHCEFIFMDSHYAKVGCNSLWKPSIVESLLMLPPDFYGKMRFCRNKVFLTLHIILTLKCLGGGQGDPLPCGFSKNVSSKESVKPWFFVTFNIILKNIFAEKFIEFPQVVQKIWRNYLSILAIFINFPQFFGFLTFPCYKETNDIAYNRWCHHFFTFNIL